MAAMPRQPIDPATAQLCNRVESPSTVTVVAPVLPSSKSFKTFNILPTCRTAGGRQGLCLWDCVTPTLAINQRFVLKILASSPRVRVASWFSLLLLAMLAMPRLSAAQALPSGWATQDIGNPPNAGSATYASGTFTVTGGGADIAGTADQFRFVYLQLTGDGTVVARVNSLQQTRPWSKAGVMIRESLSAGAKNAYTLVSVSKGSVFQRRTATAGTTLSTFAG